ncbi:Uncharacterised protein [Bordetella ansorpii]|uniref:DUF2399 domain-containing protein n=1 Tax=Bordetella ansorpii TaxID=288768 RepID=A0A157SAL4_9BORD|nr:hypothetical protein [Bordetella ansorpii]SAI67462.1 Uncharacterised protein [Bordetella ansorpii]
MSNPHEQAWDDVPRGRNARDRRARRPVPDALPEALTPEDRTLLRGWVRSDASRRSRAVLMTEAGQNGIERAEALCDALLRQGWLVRHEKLRGGVWSWDAVTWRDLPRLQALLGITGPRERGRQRQDRIAQAQAWLEARAAMPDTHRLDPDLHDELAQALERLRGDKSLRIDVLDTRLDLLNALADWHDAGAQGMRRDFALRAQGATKSISLADWRWLEASFDLERLNISNFAPLIWLAGDLLLSRQGRRIDVGAVRFQGLPIEDVGRADSARGPARWWLVENRASFERQAAKLAPEVALVWLPGRPGRQWLQAMAHLLSLLPAPAWISADADPAGVDIACAVGSLWEGLGLPWEPHLMDAGQLDAARQNWPLNAHDRRLIGALLQRPALPAVLRDLCEAMAASSRKAEQEGWL